MKKIFKNKLIILIFFILITILLIPNYSNAKTTGYEYVIDDYNINVIVNENSTLDITETITVNFRIPKDGIIRKIPLKNTITRLDGSTFTQKAKISNISIANKYKEQNKDGCKILTIESENPSTVGNQTYNIKYTYDIGKDKIKNADELYFNLIENQWDTTIKKVSFEIVMPKEFDQTKLNFAIGNLPSTTANVKYYVEGNTIKGNTLTTLNPGQPLTLQLSLPDKYFDTGINIAILIIIISIIITVTIVGINIWKKHKNK